MEDKTIIDLDDATIEAKLKMNAPPRDVAAILMNLNWVRDVDIDDDDVSEGYLHFHVELTEKAIKELCGSEE